MATQIIINSSNFNTESSTFIYTFPSTQALTDSEIGVSTCNIFNSIYNVSAELNTNSIQIMFPSGLSSYITTSYTIPDGFYDDVSFNYYLQSIFLSGLFYTAASSSLKITTYLSVGVSTNQYANTITTYPIPFTATPPTGATWTANSGTLRSPQIKFLGSTGLLFGFLNNVWYGATNTELITNSIICPQINFSQSIILTCSIIANTGLSFPSNMLYSMPINSSFGSMISSPNSEIIYSNISSTNVKTVELKIFDQLLKPLKLLDSNVLIVLSIRPKRK
jgi:hypothetical protein